MKKPKNRRKPRLAHKTLPLRMLKGLEGLEPRQMLAANILASGDSSLNVPGGTQDLELSVSIPDRPAGTTAALMISIEPRIGSAFDPATPIVIAEGGGTVTPTSAFSNADGGESIVVSVPTGEHTLTIGGDSSAIGGFRVSVSMLGDVQNDDGEVSQFERTLATAALTQSLGTGNFVTDQFYLAQGIDMSQDLFDPGFDVNGDGQIDGTDISSTLANAEIGFVNVEIRTDDEGPAFGTIALTNDTGISATDGITTDAGVDVEITDESNIISLFASLNGGGAVNITNSATGLNSGQVSISTATIGTLAGGSITTGPQVLTLTAADDLGNESSTDFVFTFIDSNTAPTVIGLADQTATEDAPFNFDLSAFFNDADSGDVLLYTAAAAPAWLTVDTDGTLSGTPTNADVGSTTITFTATDSQGLSVSGAFAIDVLNTNDAPTLINAGADNDQNADEDSPFTFDYSALFSDPDVGDTLTFSATQGTSFPGSALPAWLSDNNGVLTGTPVAADAGTFSVTVLAIDAVGGQAETTFDITVLNFNDPPTVVSNIPDQSATEDVAFNLDISGFFTDEDPGDTLTFGIDDIPDWLSINPTTGLLTGTPDDADVGVVNLVASATDSFGARTVDGFMLTVANVNDAPVLANQSLGVDPAATNGTVVGTIVVDDPDPGETLTFVLDSGDPTNIFALNSATGEITVADSTLLVDGSFVPITVTVTDAAGASSTGMVTINVTSNFAPVAVDDTGITVLDNATVSFDVIGNDTDADGDTLTIQSADMTSAMGATITFTGGTVTYDPQLATALTALRPGESATDTFDYVVSDGNGGFDTGTVTVTVNGVDVAQYRLEVQDENGIVTTTVAAGDTFTLVAFVRDVQDSPQGVFSAFIDVEYQGALASPVGAIVHSSTYPSGPSGDNTQPGLLDEVGGVDGITPLGGDEFEVFRQEFTATSAGAILFQSNATEDQVQHPTLIFGDSVTLPTNQIVFGSTTLAVTGPVPPLSSSTGVFTHNAANAFDVNADGSVSPLDALLVINAMEEGFEAAGTHTDVNGDAGLSPIDALLVINELVVADAGLAASQGGVDSDVSQADLQSAFEFVFEQLDDEDISVNELASLDSSLIVAILQASAADEADQSSLWQQLAEDLATALND